MNATTRVKSSRRNEDFPEETHLAQFIFEFETLDALLCSRRILFVSEDAEKPRRKLRIGNENTEKENSGRVTRLDWSVLDVFRKKTV